MNQTAACYITDRACFAKGFTTGEPWQLR